MVYKENSKSYNFLFAIAIILYVSALYTPVKVQIPSVSLPFLFSGTQFAEMLGGHTFISALFAAIFLVAIAVSLYYTNDSFFLMTSQPRILPVMYLILAFSNPEAVFFSVYHLVAILLLWALYFNVRYAVEEENKMSSLFISVLLYSLASLILPMLIFVPVIFFFINLFYARGNYFKLVVVFLSALITPFLYLVSIRYLLPKAEIAPYFDFFWKSLSNMSVDFTPRKMSDFFMLGMIAVVYIRSLFFVLKRRSSYNVSSSRAFNIGIIFSVILFLLIILYGSHISSLMQIILYIPVSLIIFAFIKHKESKNQSRVFIILMILSILMYRISCFI